MVNTFLLFMGVLVFGILMLISLILALIKFARPEKDPLTKFWFAGGILALVGLILCIVLLVKKVTTKTKEFSETFMSLGMKQAMLMDSLGGAYNTTNINENEQIKLLQSIEPHNVHGGVLPEFYSYLGYRDYYRLPLRFPYSLHCLEVPDAASLFNEEHVSRFDENNNGEVFCGVENITSFIFNEAIIAGIYIETGSTKKAYFVYYFDKNKLQKLSSEKALFDILSRNRLDKEKLMSCEQYYNLLSSYH